MFTKPLDSHHDRESRNVSKLGLSVSHESSRGSRRHFICHLDGSQLKESARVSSTNTSFLTRDVPPSHGSKQAATWLRSLPASAV